MPIMTRMRESMPVILFGLLIAFLITIIFEWGMDYLGLSGGQQSVVGEVNGKKITYQEFNELVRQASESQKQRTGVEPDDNQQKQLRQQVWDQIVTQRIVEQEIAKLGLQVPDQEIIDWVRGDTPPEDLKQNFVDSTGQFRRDMYDQFLANPNQFIQDPEQQDRAYGTKWLANYESNLRQRRLSEKLQSLLTASIRVNEGELRSRFADQSVKYNALFAFFEPNAFVKDEDVTVTDADLKAYYDDNIESYKFDASRKLKYATFLENPSAQDSADALKSIQDDYKAALGGTDFLSLAETRAEKPDSGSWFRHGELGADLESAAFAAKVGDIVGPIVQPDGYHLLKLLEERKSADAFVRASHILIQVPADAESTKAKAAAADVARRARGGENFAALAATYSKDPSNAPKGGDLGWFGKGRMVKEFENACMNARVGEIVGPVRTQFGLHIINVTGRDARELKLARIVSKIVASPQTREDVYQRANDFSANAKKADFVQEATSISIEPKEAEVQEKGGFIPGLGVNESVTKWAFKNKIGAVSDAYSIPNGWGVFTIVEVKEAGVKPFNDVKEQFRATVLRNKKIEKLKEVAAGLKEKLAPGDSLTKLASLDSRLQVQRTGEFTLNTSAPGVGRDLNFFGALEAMNVGQISPPITSPRGAYLIQLVAKTSFDSTAFAGQRESLRSQLLQEKRGRYIGEWLTKMKEAANIEDNRDIFFR